MIKFVKENILILLIPLIIALVMFNSISITLSDILFNNSVIHEQISIIDIVYKFFCIPVNLNENYSYISEFYNYNLLDKSRLLFIYISCIAILIIRQSIYMKKQRYFILHRYKTIKIILFKNVLNNIILITIYIFIIKLTIFFSFILDKNLLNKNFLNSNYFDINMNFIDLISSFLYLSFKELIVLFTISFISLIIFYIFNDLICFIINVLLIGVFTFLQVNTELVINEFIPFNTNIYFYILIFLLLNSIIFQINNITLKKIDM